MPNRDKRSLGHVPRLVFRFPGFIRFTAYTELIHVDVKPAARTSDRCQLTHYGSLEECIIANALIDGGSVLICRHTRIGIDPLAYRPNDSCPEASSILKFGSTFRRNVACPMLCTSEIVSVAQRLV
jgi:hypothetical protein